MQETNISPPSDAEIEHIDFFEYIEIILRRKKFILTITISVFILSVVVALLLPKIYSSTARILPPQQDQGLMALMLGQTGGANLAGLAGNILGTGTPADQVASILKSERIKGEIIERFKLMGEYNVDYRLDMYKMMDDIVKIKAGKKDGIITITAQDENPKKAAAIANAYIDELAKLTAEMSTSNAGRNRGFLEGRLARARADLARAEDALKAFQSKYKALDVPGQAKATIEGIAQLKAQLAVQEAQLSALRSQFTDSTQEVMNAKATVGNLRAQIARLEGNGTGALPSVGSVPSLAQDQVRLMREFKTQEMIVELLTKQYEISKLTEAKDINTIQVIQKAEIPDKKVKPKRQLIVLFSTFFAFAVSIIIVFIQEFKHKISTDNMQRLNKILTLLKEW